MADLKITQLNAVTTPLTTDIMPIVTDPGGTPETKKVTLANLGAVIGGGGSTSWVQNAIPGGSVDGSNTLFTLSSAYVANSLQVYRDGQRMTLTADYTETSPAGGTFTFVKAPVTGTVVSADYQHAVSTSGNADTLDGHHWTEVPGTNSFITGEVPAGSVNNSNTLFTCAGAYIAGSLEVYRDGQRMKLTDDYVETSPGAGTFTFVTAPMTGSNITVDYQSLITTAGNADTLDGHHFSDTYLAPRGFLINGKFVPSVSSNNLTVALKTMAGNDPSAGDPVTVRIGDTVRSITTAKSFTVNAGTNWCNAGSTELAAKEIDYFVYLFYSVADAKVGIGASRLPFITSGNSEMTGYTTDPRAFMYNQTDIPNFSTGDCIENIGRFAATLSAGAGYTWSVPTFTTANLIQRPIFETRTLTYLPTYSATSPMTWGSVSTVTAEYQLVGRKLYCHVDANGTTSGTAANELKFTLPFQPRNQTVVCGSVSDSLFLTGYCYTETSTTAYVRKSDISNFALSTSRGFNMTLDIML